MDIIVLCEDFSSGSEHGDVKIPEDWNRESPGRKSLVLNNEVQDKKVL